MCSKAKEASMSYQRVQILLTTEQYRALKRQARIRGATMSALVREMVARGLEAGEDWIERTRRVTREMLETRGGEPMGIDAVELIREMREERADAIEPFTYAGRS
jgi:predicted DNA-binding protein